MRFILDFLGRHRIVVVVLAVASVLAGVAKSRPIADAVPAEARKQPEQIVADAAKALRSVRSYHFDLSQQYESGTLHIRGDVTSSHRAHFSISRGDLSGESIVIGQDVYFRANRAFWSTLRGGRLQPALVDRLSDRWMRPAFRANDWMVGLTRRMSPQVVARCLQVNVGTLRKHGLMPYEGRSVVGVSDIGDAPGGVHWSLLVETVDAQMPVRLTRTEGRTPGGSYEPDCDEPWATKAWTTDLRFSWFDRPVSVKAPRDVLNPGTQAGPFQPF